MTLKSSNTNFIYNFIFQRFTMSPQYDTYEFNVQLYFGRFYVDIDIYVTGMLLILYTIIIIFEIYNYIKLFCYPFFYYCELNERIINENQ